MGFREAYTARAGKFAATIKTISDDAGLMFKPKQAREAIINSMKAGGRAWQMQALEGGDFDRFSDYIKRIPFSYPTRSRKFNLRRLRLAHSMSPGSKLGRAWSDMLRPLHGYDPFKELSHIPDALFNEYRRANERLLNRRFSSRSGNFKSLRADIRAWARKLLMAKVEAAAKDRKLFAPLVMTGTLRQAAWTRSRVVVKKTRKSGWAISIVIPREGRQNIHALRALGPPPPPWEVEYVGRKCAEAFAKIARGERVSDPIALTRRSA
jgi:hypothetical protein